MLRECVILLTAASPLDDLRARGVAAAEGRLRGEEAAQVEHGRFVDQESQGQPGGPLQSLSTAHEPHSHQSAQRQKRVMSRECNLQKNHIFKCSPWKYTTICSKQGYDDVGAFAYDIFS